MDLITAREASERLGCSRRHVRHLAAQGKLTPVGHGLINATSLVRYQATHKGAVGRAWAEATAWGAIAILTGETASWMGQSQRSRLKAALRQATAAGLVEKTRNRAQVRHYHAHHSAERLLRDDIVETGSNTALLGLAAANEGVDGYIATQDLQRLISEYVLTEDVDGQISLRCTTFDLSTVHKIATSGNVLASLDLAESLTTRERAAGLRGLAAALEQLRG